MLVTLDLGTRSRRARSGRGDTAVGSVRSALPRAPAGVLAVRPTGGADYRREALRTDDCEQFSRCNRCEASSSLDEVLECQGCGKPLMNWSRLGDLNPGPTHYEGVVNAFPQGFLGVQGLF